MMERSNDRRNWFIAALLCLVLAAEFFGLCIVLAFSTYGYIMFGLSLLFGSVFLIAFFMAFGTRIWQAFILASALALAIVITVPRLFG